MIEHETKSLPHAFLNQLFLFNLEYHLFIDVYTRTVRQHLNGYSDKNYNLIFTWKSKVIIINNDISIFYSMHDVLYCREE